MSDTQSDPNPLFVKKSEVKKGKIWHKLANQRIHKQHHGGEIPENDRHAIPKYRSPIDDHNASPEETNAALAKLETKIKVLKEKDTTPSSQNTAQTQQSSQDDWYD